jgi:hypothetical protein
VKLSTAVPKPKRRPRAARQPIARSGKPKAVNAARRKREYARTYHSRARVKFVKSLPCTYCIALSPLFAWIETQSHNAHTENGGRGRKAGYETIIPLCASHHRRYDEYEYPFDRKNELMRQAMKDAAKEIERRWQAASHRETRK